MRSLSGIQLSLSPYRSWQSAGPTDICRQISNKTREQSDELENRDLPTSGRITAARKVVPGRSRRGVFASDDCRLPLGEGRIGGGERLDAD